MSFKQNDRFYEYMNENKDIRFKAKCFKCGTKMHDVNLQLPPEKRLCWEHRELKTILQHATQGLGKVV